MDPPQVKKKDKIRRMERRHKSTMATPLAYQSKKARKTVATEKPLWFGCTIIKE